MILAVYGKTSIIYRAWVKKGNFHIQNAARISSNHLSGGIKKKLGKQLMFILLCIQEAPSASVWKHAVCPALHLKCCNGPGIFGFLRTSREIAKLNHGRVLLLKKFAKLLIAIK